MRSPYTRSGALFLHGEQYYFENPMSGTLFLHGDSIILKYSDGMSTGKRAHCPPLSATAMRQALVLRLWHEILTTACCFLYVI